MAELNENLWAPWRSEYIKSLSGGAPSNGCFLCHYSTHPDLDLENHVICRRPECFMVMNRFPYTNGHLLVVPNEHEGQLDQLNPGVLVELMSLVQHGVSMLRRVVKAEGFNVGFNIGGCAGAGVPDHIHMHVVPRWNADTNFMAVVGKVRVIPQSLDELRDGLIEAGRSLGIDGV